MSTARNRSLYRTAGLIGTALGALVLAACVLAWLFGDTILNSYGRKKAERAYARAHPGSSLRIGQLDYALGANRLTAQSLTLSSTGMVLTTGPASLADVRWTKLLKQAFSPADLLAHAVLDVTNLSAEFPVSRYGLRCGRLIASMASSNLLLEGVQVQPSIGDEAFFADDAFRHPRFVLVLPECRVSGLEYAAALTGAAFRARSIHFERPFFDALINRDKLPKPSVRRPPMVHEALANIAQAIQVGSLTITNGTVKYCERLAVGAKPAELTFGTVSLSAEGIANRGGAANTIQVQGEGRLMNSGVMRVAMAIPLNQPEFSLRYSGSLAGMDLRRLDAFLDIAESTRIKSGLAEGAAFDIAVTNGHARGRVQAIYQDLEIALLNKETGAEKGFSSRVTSFFMNLIKIRKANLPGMAGGLKEGQVDYGRKPDDEFMQFVWFALRTGVLDVITH